MNCRVFECLFAAICAFTLSLCTPSMLLAQCNSASASHSAGKEDFSHKDFIVEYSKPLVEAEGDESSADDAIWNVDNELGWHKGFATALHTVYRNCTYTKEHLCLEDGSLWIVHEDDLSLIEKWLNDVVAIKPHHPYIYKSRYQFIVVNQRTNESVRANVASYGYDNQRAITRIDDANGEVMIDDGSVWQVDDVQTLAQWAEGNKVVIGINGSWFSFYANIIINTQTEPITYIKARCRR